MSCQNKKKAYPSNLSELIRQCFLQNRQIPVVKQLIRISPLVLSVIIHHL